MVDLFPDPWLLLARNSAGHFSCCIELSIDGNLYVTRYGKSTVAKVSPEGEVLLEVQLAGRSCTNLTFGGEDGRTCYVTIAEHGNAEYFRTDKPGRCWKLQQH